MSNDPKAAGAADASAHVRGSTSPKKRLMRLFQHAEAALLPKALLTTEGAHLDVEGAWSELETLLSTERTSSGASGRLTLLASAATNQGARQRYLETFGCVGVRRFSPGTAANLRIYSMPVETFPNHINNVYLVREPGHTTLIDVGSGLPSSKRDMALGFAIVRAIFGEDIVYEAVDVALVTHAHIDHFGGVMDLRATSGAALAVHELDARVLASFEERVIIASKDVEIFLRRAGVSRHHTSELLALYMQSRSWFKPVEVDIRLRDGDTVGGGHRVIHTPGHCPGQVCLLVGDVLLTSDHVLARISPHQFPQAITAFGGLENYLRSLDKVRAIPGVTLALGGHEEPIDDLYARALAIAAFHKERLDEVLKLCEAPRTVVEIAGAMFGKKEGYDEILALEEAGAHVEYLHQLGRIVVDNVDEVAAADVPVFRYKKKG